MKHDKIYHNFECEFHAFMSSLGTNAHLPLCIFFMVGIKKSLKIHYENNNKDSYCFDCEYYYEDVNKTIKHIEFFKLVITCLVNIYEANANINAKFPLKMMKTCIKILSDLLYSQCNKLFDLKVKVNRLAISSQQTEISSGDDNILTKLHHHHHHYKKLLALTKVYYDHLLNKYDYDPVIWSFYSKVNL